MARKGWLAGMYADCECGGDYPCNHGGTFYFVVFGDTRGKARYEAFCRLINEYGWGEVDLQYTDGDLSVRRAPWADCIPEPRDRATRAEMFEHAVQLWCGVCSQRMVPGSTYRWEIGTIVGDEVYHERCIPKEAVA